MSAIRGVTIAPATITADADITITDFAVTGPSNRTNTIAVRAILGSDLVLSRCLVDGGDALAIQATANASAIGIDMTSGGDLLVQDSGLFSGTADAQGTTGGATATAIAVYAPAGNATVIRSEIVPSDASATVTGGNVTDATASAFGFSTLLSSASLPTYVGDEVIIRETRVDFGIAEASTAGTQEVNVAGVVALGADLTIVNSMVVDGGAGDIGTATTGSGIAVGVLGGFGMTVDMANNTVVFPVVGLGMLMQTDPMLAGMAWVGTGTTDVSVVNNVVDMSATMGVPALADWAPGGSAVLVFNNDLVGVNLYNGISDIGEVNACGWPGCEGAADNISVDPSLDADYLIDDLGDPVVDAGVDPIWFGVVNTVDIQFNSRPKWFGFDVGADEWAVGSPYLRLEMFTNGLDFDFHSYTPGGDYIWFQNTDGVGIHLQDRTSSVSDILTIFEVQDGTYTVRIHNWSGQSDARSICTGAGSVNVYDEDGLLETVTLPTSGCSDTSDWMTLMIITDGVYTVINTLD